MSKTPYKRTTYDTLLVRLREPRRFIQVLSGPRQVGKTTLATQVMKGLEGPSLYISADGPTLQSTSWIEQHWETARFRARESRQGGALLVLDEIQKIPGWSETIKMLWDEDTKQDLCVRVLLLGSSRLLVEKGLSESLAGRFELIPISHWSFAEMQGVFGWNVEQYIFYGGYPGAAGLIHDSERWSRYILDALIETTLSRDILLMSRIEKPALLRRLFQLACDYSAQILSYQKMVGQLQDVGNTTTLAHYLDLLSSAGIVAGLQKYSPKSHIQRSSSPKLLALNTALLTAHSEHSFESARKDPAFWGRLVETTVGAHLVNSLVGTKGEIFYWRDRGKELDYVLKRGRSLVAIEVKSGRKKESLPGIAEFSKRFQPQRKLLVGTGGISIEEFLTKPAKIWLE